MGVKHEVKFNWQDIDDLARVQAKKILTQFPDTTKRIILWGVPRGGIYAALAIQNALCHKMRIAELTMDPHEADCYVDDIMDSGSTLRQTKEKYGMKPFFFLVDKGEAVKTIASNVPLTRQDTWMVFPWELQNGEASSTTSDSGPQENIRRILQYIGDDPDRDGLKKTPDRVVRSYSELFSGYKKTDEDIKELMTTFEGIPCDEMVLLKDCEFTSFCLASSQIVNAVGGAKKARTVRAGDQLYTLIDGEVKKTTVSSVITHSSRELVKVITEKGVVVVTPDHPFATQDGWEEAQNLKGKEIEWSRPKSLRRAKYHPKLGYWMGYAIGAGGDPHHMRQKFPRVVLASEKCLQGFIDGYADGDGCRTTTAGRVVISSNVPFLKEFANVIDARFNPKKENGSCTLYVSDRWNKPNWYAKHGFRQEIHRSTVNESNFVRVVDVQRVCASGGKPFKVYSFQCAPYPTFLTGGFLTHNCEHHMLPFSGVAHIAYIPEHANKILGLSKLARLLEVYARRLQVQERLTDQITAALVKYLQPKGAACVISARHSCVSCRGVGKQNAKMVTASLKGVFREEQKARNELYYCIGASL